MWVDFFRAKTPPAIKAQIKPWMLRNDIALCEPVVCELLRSAARSERTVIQRHLTTMPTLPTPRTLWREAIRLGQNCCDAGVLVSTLDLLIATICLRYGASLVTSDARFAAVAKLSRLNANILVREA